MKKLFFRSLWFLLFALVYFVLINILYMAVIVKTDNDFRKRIESLNFKHPDLEVLVYGASTTLDGIDTELLTSNGFRSYNFAIGGSSIKTNVIQLREYLAKCSVNPRYVILGVNSSMVDSFDDEEINPIVEVTMKDHHYNLNDSPILRFKWLGFEFLKKIVSKNHREAILSYGQIKFKKTVPDDTEYVDQYLDIDRYENSFWIGEMIKLCTMNQMELILIEMPGYKMTQNLSPTGLQIISHRNGYRAKLYNFNSRAFCKRFDDQKDWIGNSHLNEYGAEKFTDAILDIVEVPEMLVNYR